MADDLINAVKENDVPLVKQLIGRGANVNHVDGYGCTALYWASTRGFVEYAKVLLEANADVDRANLYGETPLQSTSSRGHAECVKVLLVPFLFVLCMKKTISLSLCSSSLSGR